VYGGRVEIEHRSRVDVLCLGRDRVPHPHVGVREA
jgi:hypothetical protein